LDHRQQSLGDDHFSMGDPPRPTRTAAVGLVIAIAAAGLIGYLIARPRTPVRATPAPTASSSSIPSAVLLGPASTAGYTVADDIATHQILIFGGITDNAATWIWDGLRWILAQPRASPPGRIDAAAAYDPALRLVLLFGGHGAPGTDLNDTWAWDGTNWRELDKGSTVGPRSDASMTWDPALNEMVLVAGGPGDSATATWVLNRTHWTRLQSGLPFPPAAIAVAFDPGTHALVAVASGQVPVPPPGSQTQTWAWNGGAWRRIATRNDPAAGVVVGLGWDPLGHRLLMFGGGTSLPDPGRLWTWDGTEWIQLPRTLGVPILDGTLVSNDTALLLIGALDTSPQRPAPIKVWSWADASWRLAVG
jgi:hypothetical protein